MQFYSTIFHQNNHLTKPHKLWSIVQFTIWCIRFIREISENLRQILYNLRQIFEILSQIFDKLRQIFVKLRQIFENLRDIFENMTQIFDYLRPIFVTLRKIFDNLRQISSTASTGCNLAVIALSTFATAANAFLFVQKHHLKVASGFEEVLGAE